MTEFLWKRNLRGLGGMVRWISGESGEGALDARGVGRFRRHLKRVGRNQLPGSELRNGVEVQGMARVGGMDEMDG